MEITGTVSGSSKPKYYPGRNSWGEEIQIPKFAIFVVDEKGNEHKAMVHLKHYSEGDFPDSHSPDNTKERKSPFKGDKVRYTTHGERGGWGNVTLNQEFEILDNIGEREWREQKEKEWKAKEVERQAKYEREKAVKKEIREREKIEREQKHRDYIATIPEEFREIFKDEKEYVFKVMINVIRDAYWLGPIGEGAGGQRDEGDGVSFPGTGMRRPHGALYEMPHNQRTRVLNVAQNGGLILGDEGFISTEKGEKFLATMDVCEDCKTVRSAYRLQWFHQTGPITVMKGEYITFLCDCKYAEKKKGEHLQQGSNVGSFISERINRDTPKKED